MDSFSLSPSLVNLWMSPTIKSLGIRYSPWRPRASRVVCHVRANGCKNPTISCSKHFFPVDDGLKPCDCEAAKKVWLAAQLGRSVCRLGGSHVLRQLLCRNTHKHTCSAIPLTLSALFDSHGVSFLSFCFRDACSMALSSFTSKEYKGQNS